MNDTLENFEVKVANIDDCDAIMKLLNDAAIWMVNKGITCQWTPGNVFEDRPYFEEMIKTNNFYTVEIDKRIVGTFLIRWTDEDIWGEDDGKAGYIHHLAIHRDYGSMGLGNELINWAQHLMKKNNKMYIRLDCVAKNELLNQYYLDRQFEFIKTYTYFDGVLGNLYEKML